MSSSRPSPQQERRKAARRGASRQGRGSCLVLLVGTLVASAGCVSQGDFLRLQERVADYHQSERNEPDPFARIAQLSADVEALREEVRDLKGELEVARKQATDALQEVERTRAALASGGPENAAIDGGEGPGAGVIEPEDPIAAPGPDQELARYQAALEAWRADEYPVCIERFTSFLQSWPNSSYADDAAYWLADCTYKNGEFKRAVVRFNAVVSVYPESPKAPDALYRQGESLLKLGPKFHEAARTVFKNVRKEYPDSERAGEAAKQLERLGAG